MSLIKNSASTIVKSTSGINKSHTISFEYVSNDKCMDITKMALSCLDKHLGNHDLCKIPIGGVRLCKLEYIDKNEKRKKNIVRIEY